MPAVSPGHLVRAALLLASTLLLAPFVFAAVPAARRPDRAPTAPATAAFGALQTPTVTGTGSITPLPSATPTATHTPGATSTATATPTSQPPGTETATASATATASRTPTATATLGFVPRVYLPLIRYEYVPPCLLADGGFEAGTPNLYWDEYSATFGTPLCTVVRCGTGGGTGPRSGAWWVWFGGTTTVESAYMRQTVTIPPGTATLSYWLEIPVALGQSGDFLEVRIDGALIQRYTVASRPNFLRYALAQHNVTQYANGGPHQISFESTTYGGYQQPTSFFVDDVNLCIR